MSSKKKKKKPVVRFYVDFKLKYEHLLQQRTPGQCVCVPACQKVLKNGHPNAEFRSAGLRGRFGKQHLT